MLLYRAAALCANSLPYLHSCFLQHRHCLHRSLQRDLLQVIRRVLEGPHLHQHTRARSKSQLPGSAMWHANACMHSAATGARAYAHGATLSHNPCTAAQGNCQRVRTAELSCLPHCYCLPTSQPQVRLTVTQQRQKPGAALTAAGRRVASLCCLLNRWGAAAYCCCCCWLWLQQLC